MPDAAPTRATQKAAPRTRRRLRVPAPLVLLSPFGLLFVGFYLLPIAWAFRTSLYVDRLIGGEHYVGFDAYSRVVHDGSFWHGFGNLGILAVTQVPVSIGLALLFALVLDGRSLRAPGVYRLVIFIPYAVPTVIAGLMWGFMYDKDVGPLEAISSGLGLGSPDLLSPGLILPALGNILTWSGTGVAMIILYTALKGIPTEVEEAAAVDGARARHVIRDIKLPLLRPALALLALIALISTLQLFNEPAVLHALSPPAIGDDFTPNFYAYTLAFRGSQENYAAAVAFVLAAIVLVASYGGMALSRLRRSS